MVLVLLACEDECRFGTKWSWYLVLAKMSFVWNEAVLVPLACEVEFVYGTKWSWYLWLAKMSVPMERSGLGTFGSRR